MPLSLNGTVPNAPTTSAQPYDLSLLPIFFWTIVARSWCFSTLPFSFAHDPQSSVIATFLPLINDHQIWSFDLNPFVCLHAEVAKKVVIKIIPNFQYTFQDLVIPYNYYSIPSHLFPTYPSGLPRPHSCFLLHSFYAKFRHALTMWVMVSSFSLHIRHFESVRFVNDSFDVVHLHFLIFCGKY